MYNLVVMLGRGCGRAKEVALSWSGRPGMSAAGASAALNKQNGVQHEDQQRRSEGDIISGFLRTTQEEARQGPEGTA